MRNVLIYFAIKYKGDFLKILKAIKEKELIPDDELENINNSNIKAITFIDEEYPEVLRNMTIPPLVLFYRGDLSLLKSKPILAVVGARSSSDYGKDATSKVLLELFQEGEVTIISGFAKGIDTLAHSLALKNNQKTIAVLGCGIDVCYPLNNRELYNDIEEFGLIISEYPEGCEPQKNYFPMRNRIIASLAKGILVSDAKIKSGTQITVKYGLEMNKDIFAIPHSVFEDSFCNYLIKEGAIPIFNGKDLAEQIF